MSIQGKRDTKHGLLCQLTIFRWHNISYHEKQRKQEIREDNYRDKQYTNS